jgi:hypothetical protein
MRIMTRLSTALMFALLFGLSTAAKADSGNTNQNQAQAQKPAPLKLKAVLIWGTDGDKPDDPTLKDLDEDVKKKLRKIFKWKEYHLVKVKNVDLNPGESKKIDLSQKCSLECENKEGLEVKLIGNGKLVKKVKQAMPMTDWLVLGGDDKDSNAWFVVIMPEAEAPSLKESK